jgi:hypothetical protein
LTTIQDPDHNQFEDIMAQLMLNLEAQLRDFGAVSATYSGVQLGSPTEQHEIPRLQIRTEWK